MGVSNSSLSCRVAAALMDFHLQSFAGRNSTNHLVSFFYILSLSDLLVLTHNLLAATRNISLEITYSVRSFCSLLRSTRDGN